MIETAPSFSIYSNNPGEGEEERENELIDKETNLVRSVTIGEQIDGTVVAVGSEDFSFVKPNMDLIKEEGDEGEEVVMNGFEKIGNGDEEVEVEPPSPPMYLAAGLGIRDATIDIDFGVERENSEEYRELLEEYPNHPLVLRNYAHFLQNKGDLEGAEYYYFRATQADPLDGETMAQYAKLVWELHRDREKALTYFEQATQIAPEDSNVLAAYAKFLWEIDDGRDGNSDHVQQEDTEKLNHSALHRAEKSEGKSDGCSTCPVSGAGGLSEGADPDNYYKSLIEERSSDPLSLKTYAQFLYQSKGDLQGAEECYSRAILADPQDGESLSQYAKVVWDLYHDQDRALAYFERAIQAAPEDSNVLAAYASFLWAIDDDEEVDKQLDSLSERLLASSVGA